MMVVRVENVIHLSKGRLETSSFLLSSFVLRPFLRKGSAAGKEGEREWKKKNGYINGH